MAQVILKEIYDHEPTEKDVLDYAVNIGIDLDEEKHLLWIAREGINEHLPGDWKPCQDSTGEVYYFNFSTGESIWEHPLDEDYKEKVRKERSKNTSSATESQGRKKEQKVGHSSEKLHKEDRNKPKENCGENRQQTQEIGGTTRLLKQEIDRPNREVTQNCRITLTQQIDRQLKNRHVAKQERSANREITQEVGEASNNRQATRQESGVNRKEIQEMSGTNSLTKRNKAEEVDREHIELIERMRLREQKLVEELQELKDGQCPSYTYVLQQELDAEKIKRNKMEGEIESLRNQMNVILQDNNNNSGKKDNVLNSKKNEQKNSSSSSCCIVC